MRPGAAAASTAAGGAVEPHAVFGVVRSLSGRAWRARPHDPSDARSIAERHQLPNVIGRILAGRGVSADAVEGFLEPTLRDTLPDPSRLADMDAAAERLAAAIAGRERIAVLADYDVDGATSAALVVRYLRHFGLEPLIHVPDRIVEGYGPSEAGLARLADAGATLIVTVDCGVAAGAAFATLGGRADVVVIDHHQPGEALPAVAALVNPNRHDDLSGLGYLAAVGVVFLVLVAVSRALRRAGVPGDGGEPDLLGLLGFAALGTVCDVVPLTGLNRTLVAQGLKVIAGRGNPGLVALCDAARLDGPPNVHHLGFLLGPRINAGGRIGRSDLGLSLLTTDDPGEARALAEELDRLNTERQAIEARACDEASEQVEARCAESGERAVVLAASPDWHPGVIGLVAARLKERFNRPAFAIALGEDGLGRGSARSIAGVDLGAAVRGALDAGLLVKGGGHAMAAGLIVEARRIDEFGAYLEAALGAAVAAARSENRLSIDAPLAAGGASEALMALIERVGPYGQGHPEPRFAFPSHRVAYAKPVGHGHVRASLRSDDGARIDAIAFRAGGTPMGEALLARGGQSLHVAGRLKRDRWQGRSTIQLMIDDVAYPE